MQIKAFFSDVYRPLRLTGRSDKTVTLYNRSIHLFSETLGHPATLSDLTDINVSKHLGKLLALGRAPAGVNKERSQLLALWNLAARKNYVQEFPEVRPIPQPEVLASAWTYEELWRLRISCNCMDGSYDGVPARLWWLALHCVLWSSGERIGAVLQMTFNAIQGNKILFPAQDRKGSVKANLCPVPQYTIDAINAIREPKRDKVFAWPYTVNYLYHVYTKILRRAELDTSSRSKFHRIRRSHATHLKIAGGDPTQSLLHASPRTTAAYLDRRLIPARTDLLPQFGQVQG